MVGGVGLGVARAIVDKSQRMRMGVADGGFGFAAGLSLFIFFDDDLFMLVQMVPCFWKSCKVR